MVLSVDERIGRTAPAPPRKQRKETPLSQDLFRDNRDTANMLAPRLTESQRIAEHCYDRYQTSPIQQPPRPARQPAGRAMTWVNTSTSQVQPRPTPSRLASGSVQTLTTDLSHPLQ